MRTPLLAAVAAALCLVAGAARAQNPLVELVTQADSPSFLADPGDGRLFISELGGRIRIFANGQLQASNDAFLDLSGLVDHAGEGGMHSFAFDPDFATNHFFYVEYTRTGSGGSPLESVIARYTADPNDPNHADPASARIVLTQQSPVGPGFSNHKGGQLQFGPDHLLYFAFGDGGSSNDPLCLSQTHGVLFGKMLRIDPSGDDFPDANHNYAIPAGNPFLGDPNYAPEIWALGLRNPYRYSFDRDTGDLWIGDVGESTREEVDMDAAPNAGRGKNYGWKVWEGTHCHVPDESVATCPGYVTLCANDQSPMTPYTAPLADYGRSVGGTVIGGYVYRGSVPAWRGRYIFADFLSSEIFALIHDGGGWTRQPLTNDVASPISFGEDHTGELYVLSIDGGVYRLRFDLVGLTKAQRDCVRKLNEDFLQLADAASAQVRACIDQRAQRKHATNVDTCVEGDPRGRLDKLQAKAQKDDTKLCSPLTPEIGYAGADAGSAAALAAELDLAHDVLGASLDAAVVTKATDRKVAACQKAVTNALAVCQKARRAEFMRCKKAKLKADTLLQSSDLAACLAPDPKSKKIPNACDPLTGKLAKNAIANACVAKGVDLSTAFPGCNTPDPAALAACLDQAGQCRNCQLFDAADALGTTCDACAP